MDKLKGLAGKLGNNGTGNSSSDPSQPAGSAQDASVNPAGTTDQSAVGTAGGANAAGGKGDYLDQAVGFGGKQVGHNLDRNQEEKISDGIRSGATKMGYGNALGQDKN